MNVSVTLVRSCYKTMILASKFVYVFYIVHNTKDLVVCQKFDRDILLSLEIDSHRNYMLC